MLLNSSTIANISMPKTSVSNGWTGTVNTQDGHVSAYPCSNIFLEERRIRKKTNIKSYVGAHHCLSELQLYILGVIPKKKAHEYLICFSQT